ncbi:MAG: DUF2911 domain-containing protein [Bacteroidota bacterium]
MKRLILLGVLAMVHAIAMAQFPAMKTPQPSPKASVSQTVGISEVTIVYSKPGIKNRKVWGDLVPYDQVWRAGANENTTLSFSHDATVGGKLLPAGTYGLHMIPTMNDWTVILSKNSTSWGSFFYKEGEDAVRVKVKPQPVEHQEWLLYTLDNLSDKSVDVVMQWEKLKVAFKLEFDIPSIVIANARESHVRGLAGFFWQGFNQAAAYSLQNNTNFDEALSWVDQSIAINENFTNLQTKAGIVEKLGRQKEADDLRTRSMTLATEADINMLGYQHLGAGRIKEAVELFKKNAKDYPNSWNVYDSLGEAHEANGDTKLAKESYAKAFSLVKDETNKMRIGGILKKLQTKN